MNILQQAHCSIPGMVFSPKQHHIKLRRASCHKPLQHYRYVGRAVSTLAPMADGQAVCLLHLGRLGPFFFFQILDALVKCEQQNPLN